MYATSVLIIGVFLFFVGAIWNCIAESCKNDISNFYYQFGRFNPLFIGSIFLIIWGWYSTFTDFDRPKQTIPLELRESDGFQYAIIPEQYTNHSQPDMYNLNRNLGRYVSNDEKVILNYYPEARNKGLYRFSRYEVEISK